MARNVFEDNGPNTLPLQPITPRRKPLVKGGAASQKYISAATQGGADRSYQDIPVDQIQESLIKDRIDINEGIDRLAMSIKENGQQIPILVRILASGDKQYEIVVGRRRLAAHRLLGLNEIKAFVTKMDDEEAFIAQGIENSARLETSYIERARAAALATDAGYTQIAVSEFLNVSTTLINFMISNYRSLGEDLVLAIGPARGIGRRKWDALIKLLEKQGISPNAALQLVDRTVEDSAERFECLAKAVQLTGAKGASGTSPETSKRRDYLNGGVSTMRKAGQLIIKTRKDMPDDLLSDIEKQIEVLLTEIDRKRQSQEPTP
jgi:ParB family chromosome partitioning protein